MLSPNNKKNHPAEAEWFCPLLAKEFRSNSGVGWDGYGFCCGSLFDGLAAIIARGLQVLAVEFKVWLPAGRVGRPAGKDVLCLVDPHLGDLNRHRVRAGARVCLADLIGVGFPGSNAVLSAAVVICCMEDHTVTHDVYGAAIRRAP